MHSIIVNKPVFFNTFFEQNFRLDSTLWQETKYWYLCILKGIIQRYIDLINECMISVGVKCIMSWLKQWIKSHNHGVNNRTTCTVFNRINFSYFSWFGIWLYSGKIMLWPNVAPTTLWPNVLWPNVLWLNVLWPNVVDPFWKTPLFVFSETWFFMWEWGTSKVLSESQERAGCHLSEERAGCCLRVRNEPGAIWVRNEPGAVWESGTSRVPSEWGTSKVLSESQERAGCHLSEERAWCCLRVRNEPGAIWVRNEPGAVWESGTSRVPSEWGTSKVLSESQERAGCHLSEERAWLPKPEGGSEDPPPGKFCSGSSLKHLALYLPWPGFFPSCLLLCYCKHSMVRGIGAEPPPPPQKKKIRHCLVLLLYSVVLMLGLLPFHLILASRASIIL